MQNNNSELGITSISFRSKFQKQLKKLPESTQAKVRQVFYNFVTLANDKECFDILWKLTADSSSGLKLLNLNLDTDAENSLEAPSVPADFVQPLRNELRYQRKQANSNFMEIDISENCKEAFKELLAVTNDAIVAFAVYEHCNMLCQTAADDDFERTRYLLSSPKEANYFGGIRSLHFGRNEATCLKNYAPQISKLLEALRNEKISASAENVYTPMAAQLEAWKEAHPEYISDDTPPVETSLPDLNVETEASHFTEEVDSESETKARVINVESIIENGELFKTFLTVYNAITQKGFNPQEVIDNAEAISMISEAAKLLKSK